MRFLHRTRRNEIVMAWPRMGQARLVSAESKEKLNGEGLTEGALERGAARSS